MDYVGLLFSLTSSRGSGYPNTNPYSPNQAFNAQNTVLRLFPPERALFRRERRGGAY